MSLQRLILAAALATPIPLCLAASDTVVPTEENASALISFVKQNSVRISGLSDFDFGTHTSLQKSQDHTEKLCVHSSTGAYAVTATSTNGAFALRSPNGSSRIRYRLQWLAGAVTDLLPTISRGGYTSNVSDTDCAGGKNAGIRIVISRSDFNQAEPGVYTDTLILLVRAE